MIRVRYAFNPTWGLWQVVAADDVSERIYAETKDEAVAKDRAEKILGQNVTTLDDIVPTWDGAGPEEA